MSNYTVDRIEKPSFFKLAPIRNGRSKRAPYVIGFDSEAEAGKPFLYQFSHPDGHTDVLDVNRKRHDGLVTFFRYIREQCTRKDTEYVVFGFNLQYEWTQLFSSLKPSTKRASEFVIKLTVGGDDKAILIRALNEKRYTLTAEFGILNGDEFVPTTKRRVRLVDAMAFVTTSLDQASKILGIGRKLQKPKHFSRRYSHTPEFRAYAVQDAVLTQKLGEYIIGLHETYDVTQCVSAPHFAAKVFRRAFMTSEIELPHHDLEQYGLWSYHGGKNGFYLSRPSNLRNVFHYDIRSAYPEAMRQLPNIEYSQWTFSESYRPNVHAIWKTTVSYQRCNYRAFQNVEGKWPESGIISTYLTGYELDAALELGEVNILACEGYVLTGQPGGPLVDYVDTFYAMKRNAKTDAERITAKLFLNSLYGKFFQKIPVGDIDYVDMTPGLDDPVIMTDPDSDYDWRAGGLYHPPIASLITGYVRAKIHRLEHRYRSIMTSTDGFFAYEPPDPTMLGDELGQLSCERGTLRIWRERTYIFTPDDGGKETYAMHGFRGTREQLRRMPLRAGYTYHYIATQMVTLRLSETAFKGTQPGAFVDKEYELTLERAQSP